MDATGLSANGARPAAVTRSGRCSAVGIRPTLPSAFRPSYFPPRSIDPSGRANPGTSMSKSSASKPKVLIFAPREEPPETITALEGLACETVVGDRDWQLPRSSHAETVVEAARAAVGVMGTSIRHTPITRRIMQASQRLRVVAK